MATFRIIFASTSGHTEHVVSVLAEYLKTHVPGSTVIVTRVEQARPDDLISADILILASGTWNTGGIEGQLNPHMHAFLNGVAKEVDLAGKHAAIIALGDDRYFYTCRSGEHMRNFIQKRGGKILGEALLIVNDPYGQEDRVKRWAEKLLPQMS